MENRNIGNEDWNESPRQQHAALPREVPTSETGDTSLSDEELHRLIEFFRLLDRWDREEVVQ
jgi:hypothetical protein